MRLLREIIYLIPESVRQEVIFHLPQETEELRFRLGKQVCCVVQGTEYAISQQKTSSEDLNHILAVATNNSVYAVNYCIQKGYLILSGGHRLGLCGQVVTEGEQIKTIRDISSVSIRLARDLRGIGPTLSASTLIIGPPGSGKTSILRDCIRNISDIRKERLSIVDERGEIACIMQRDTQLDIGLRTDVLTGCDKRTGIAMVLRTMNPQWIAMDEITRKEDVDALIEASYCGVRFLATAHAFCKRDLQKRPVYRHLSDAKIFKQIIVLDIDHSFVLEDAE